MMAEENENVICFYDTSSLLNLQDLAFKKPFIISSVTLNELEYIKSSYNKDESIKYNCRELLRLLDSNQDKYEVIIFNNTINQILIDNGLDCNNDNKIIATASYYNCNIKPIVFYSDDLCCKLIANNLFNLEVKSSKDDVKVDDYKGFKDITVDDDELSYFYLHLNENTYNLLENQYLLLRHSHGKKVEKFRYDGMQYVPLIWRKLDNGFSEKIKPRNLLQELSFDLLQNNDITIKVLSGGQGVGKTFLMVSHALQLLKSGKTIFWVRNNIEVKNTEKIGFLPGSETEKLMPFALCLADHCGGEEGLNKLIDDHSVDIQHFGHIRGRDIKNSIIICNECENLTDEHMELLVGRVGEGASLWLDGDCNQVDSKVFEINNGLKAVVSSLKGQSLFGYVQLESCERSKTAQLAQLIRKAR